MMKLLDGIKAVASEAFGTAKQPLESATSERSGANAGLWTYVPTEKQAAEALAQLSARFAVVPPQQQTPSPSPVPQPHPTPVPRGALATPIKQMQQVTVVQEVAPVQEGSGYKPVMKEQVRQIMLPHVRQSEHEKFEQNLEEKTKRLNEAMEEFGISKPLEQAMFLATISHESRGTMETFEQPSKHKSSQSVWKGSGDMQLTGIDNYQKSSDYFQVGKLIEVKDTKGRVISRHYDGFVKDAEARALTNASEWSSRIAGWYWTKGSATSKQVGDKPADDLLDFRHASSAVNSGRPNGRVNGWSDRVATYRRALEAFGIEVSLTLAKAIEEQQKVKELVPEDKAVHREHSGQRKIATGEKQQ